MTLVVGTNAYTDVAFADVYFDDRNNLDWTASATAEKEAGLIQATQYLDGNYDWIGEHPGSNTQVLGWPRNNARDSEGRDVTGIPDAVKNACCELALLALEGPLVPAEDRGGEIKSAKAGPVAVEYMDSAPGAGRTFDFVEGILRFVTKGTGGQSDTLLRA